MKDELKKVKSENVRLRSQLEDLLRPSSSQATGLEKEEEASAVVSSRQKIVDRDPEENKKILEIIKEVEEANIKVSKGKKKSKTVSKTEKMKAAPKAKAEEKSASKAKVEKKPAPKALVEKKSAGKGRKDWSQLSESTLRRKTIKELTAYLSDYDVKGMNKGEMISLLRSTSGN